MRSCVARFLSVASEVVIGVCLLKRSKNGVYHLDGPPEGGRYGSVHLQVDRIAIR
jgi:hypothetical protein